MSVRSVIKVTCGDVVDGFYILKDENGTIFRLPVGAVEMIDGMVLRSDDSTVLKVHIPSDHGSDQEEEAKYSGRDWQQADQPRLAASESSSASSFAAWTDGATKLVIQLYQTYKPLVEERKIKTMKKMWEKMCDEMSTNYNYKYTAQQIESKWKSLERGFKIKIKDSKRTGRGRRVCPYEKELGEVLLKKQSVVPPCVMDVKTIRTSETIIQQFEQDQQNNENDWGEDEEVGHSHHVGVLAEISHREDNHNKTIMQDKSKVNYVSQVRKPYGKTRNKEIELLATAIENRTEQKRIEAEKKAEQRERLIYQLERKNDLMEEFLRQNASK